MGMGMGRGVGLYVYVLHADSGIGNFHTMRPIDPSERKMHVPIYAIRISIRVYASFDQENVNKPRKLILFTLERRLIR